MKKAILAFGLTLMSVSSVVAQEAAITSEVAAAAPAVEAVADAVMVDAPVADAIQVDAPIVGETVNEATVLDGQIIDGGQPMDMTYTAAPVAQDCGCTGAAASVVEAAPAADCGCAAPAADCGCQAAPAADCGCQAAPAFEPAPAPCCRQPRERRYVVRSAMTSMRARRCCQPAPCCN